MSGKDLLAVLAQRGVALYAKEGELYYRSEPGAYTANLRSLVAAHRSELIEILANRGLCPCCHAPGERLGSVRIDGSGRYQCSACCIAFWSPAEDAGEAVSVAPWYEPYLNGLTEEQYEAVVSFDIIERGYYTPSRHYSVPAEDPRLIWERLGLLGSAAAATR